MTLGQQFRRRNGTDLEIEKLQIWLRSIEPRLIQIVGLEFFRLSPTENDVASLGRCDDENKPLGIALNFCRQSRLAAASILFAAAALGGNAASAQQSNS